MSAPTSKSEREKKQGSEKAKKEAMVKNILGGGMRGERNKEGRTGSAAGCYGVQEKSVRGLPSTRGRNKERRKIKGNSI